MKRLAWLSIAVILIAGNVTYADDTSFTNLQQAVDFLATALESTNFVKISSTCLDSQRKPNDALLKSLQSLDQKRPLRELYADKSFPTNAPTFKLGGHIVSGHSKPASDGHLKTSHLDEVVRQVEYTPERGQVLRCRTRSRWLQVLQL